MQIEKAHSIFWIPLLVYYKMGKWVWLSGIFIRFRELRDRNNIRYFFMRSFLFSQIQILDLITKNWFWNMLALQKRFYVYYLQQGYELAYADYASEDDHPLSLNNAVTF